jgi:hypothetical protein
MAIIVHQLIWDETVLLLFALHLLRDKSESKTFGICHSLAKDVGSSTETRLST